jgi:hypothetical protein
MAIKSHFQQNLCYNEVYVFVLWIFYKIWYIIMKHAKNAFFVLIFSSIFILVGCDTEKIGSSGSSSGGSVSNNSSKDPGSTTGAAANSPNGLISANGMPDGLRSKQGTTAELTSFTLWGTKGDTSTAIAGEIIENDNGGQITVQVPAETVFPATFYVTFTGADQLLINNQSTDYNSTYTFDSPTSIEVEAQNNSYIKKYTLSVVKRSPYFTKYADKCVKDLDGNVWLSNPTQLASNWNSAVSYANSFKACGLTSSTDYNWSLPDPDKAKTMLDKVPLSYRAKPDGPGNHAPSQWFSMQLESGVPLFHLPFLLDYWSLAEKDSNNVYVIGFNAKPGTYSVLKNDPNNSFLAWPVHNGDEGDFKTLVNFSVTNQIGNSMIVGNTIFITANADTNNPNYVQIYFSSTGGSTVNINGTRYEKSNTVNIPGKFQALQIIPITIISENQEKNIYTLVLQLVLPTPTPVIPVPESTTVIPESTTVIPAESSVIPIPAPGVVIVCTSSNSKDDDPKKQPPFSRKVVATVDNNIYPNVLPAPGLCSTANIGSTPLTTLKNNPVVWWQTSNANYLGTTSYFDASNTWVDAIPTFTWTPDSSNPSGYSLTVDISTECKRDSNSPTGFSATCTTMDSTHHTNNQSITPTDASPKIKICSNNTNNLGILLDGDPFNLNINNQNISDNGDKLSAGNCAQLTLSNNGLTLAKYASIFGLTLITSTDAVEIDEGDYTKYLYPPTAIGIPFNMIAETIWCHWEISWSYSEPWYWVGTHGYFSVSSVVRVCNFPKN